MWKKENWEVHYWTAPSPNNAKARVRIQAGDKCVPPAKSRPKKRKNLATTDVQGLSMDSVEWSDRTYSVMEIIHHHGTHFPLIASVVQGYDGGDSADLELSTGQVLQLQGYGVQDRVKARNNSGTIYSIPLDYQCDVRMLDRGSSEILSLENAVRRYSLPLGVRVIKVDNDANTETTNISGEHLYLIEGFEEHFLKGNTINEEGWIDQSIIIVIPSLLDIQFATAVGMRGATDEEWLDYRNMFARSVRHMNFNNVRGYDGVVNMENIRVSAAIPDGLRFKSRLSGITEMAYENLPVTKPPSTPPEVDSHSIQRAPVSVHRSASYGGRRSRDLEETIYQNINPPPKSRSGQGQPQRGPPVKQKPSQFVAMKNLRSPQKTNDKHSGPESGDDLDVDDMFNRVLQVAEEEERKQGPATLDVKHLANHYDNDFSRHSKDNVNNKSHWQRPTGYLPQPPPKAVVAPVPKGERDGQREGPFVVSVSITDLDGDGKQGHVKIVNNNPTKFFSKYASAEDIPQNLDLLTVDEVCECLELLNLEKHVKEFKRHQIDGAMMASLKESQLQNEFHFTPFNASKLTRFARGWRPKMA